MRKFKVYVVVDQVDESGDEIDRHSDELIGEFDFIGDALNLARYAERAQEDAEVLRRIFGIMNGQEWNSDTTQEISDILTEAGFTFADVAP